MAENYLEFSEGMKLNTPEEVSWWKNEIEQAGKAYDGEDDEGFGEDWENDPDRGCWWADVQDGYVYFNSEDCSDVEAVANSVHRYLKQYDHSHGFSVEWSEHCSKLRLGEFGGGACFITAEKIEWMTTGGWVEERIKAFNESIKRDS